MTRLALATVCAVLAIVTATSAQAPSPTANEIASRLLHDILISGFGDNLKLWRQKYGYGGFCRESQISTIGSRSESLPFRAAPEWDWAVWCEDSEAGRFTEWVFHVIGPDEPIATLEHKRWHLHGEVNRLREVHRELERVLDSQFGRAREPVLVTRGADGQLVSGPDQGPREYGDAFWRDIRQWRTPELEIFVYRYVDDYNKLPEELRILVRTQKLLNAIMAADKLEAAATLRNPLEERFVTEATQRFPYVREFLKPEVMPGYSELQAVLRRALVEIDKTGAESKPLAMLVVDRLATLIEVALPDATTSFSVDPFLQERLDFRPNSQSDRPWYAGQVKRAVWIAFPDTVWGEYAFIQLLLDGFGTHGIFDRARPSSVIQQGNEFLKAKPGSPYRSLILFAIAQASESLWSLSLAPPYDECVGEEYRDTPEDKRGRAIGAYQAVIEGTKSNDPVHQFASRKLLRLRAGYDTGARYFFDCYP